MINLKYLREVCPECLPDEDAGLGQDVVQALVAQSEVAELGEHPLAAHHLVVIWHGTASGFPARMHDLTQAANWASTKKPVSVS